VEGNGRWNWNMSPRIACVRIPRSPTDPPAGAEAAALAGALLGAAPRVTPVAGHPLAFWADASGMERRGGDAATAQALLAAGREAGFPGTRVGIAGTCIAAAVATREGGSAWRVVPPGRDATWLHRRSLDLLPMEPGMREALRVLGLRRCGELGAFAAADVELRWGAAGVRAWRLARGEDPRWPFRPPPPDRAAAEAEWEPSVTTAEPLRFVLRGLIASVAGQIARRQRVPAALRLTLRLEGAGEEVRRIAPARPTAEARVLAALCEGALDGIAGSGGLPAPVAGMRLEGIEEGAALADQLDAFRTPAPDPAAVHAALLPLLARWGDGALSRPHPQGAHLPALHTVWEGQGAAAIREIAAPPRTAAPAISHQLSAISQQKTQILSEEDTPLIHTKGVLPLPLRSPAPPPLRADGGGLPLCLRRLPAPLPIHVALDAAGRPGRVARTGAVDPQLGLTVRSEGPERLSGAWWAQGYAREYWLAEGEDGSLWLLFRDARGGGWWVEGWWD
jgi:protein ImuB